MYRDFIALFLLALMLLIGFFAIINVIMWGEDDGAIDWRIS